LIYTKNHLHRGVVKGLPGRDIRVEVLDSAQQSDVLVKFAATNLDKRSAIWRAGAWDFDRLAISTIDRAVAITSAFAELKQFPSGRL